MALDERYMTGFELEEIFVDKDSGLLLANGTLEFYRDSSRTVPKAVYQLTGSPPIYGYTALPNPITLSSVGTIQNAGGDNEVIYYYPYITDPITKIESLDLYYVVCKDAGGVEQFTREAWPNITAGNDPTRQDFHVTNELSNCQFSRVFVNANETTTYAVVAESDKVFSFAPDWDFVISGSGTVIVQRIAVAGSSQIITNPSYLIEVTVSAGISSCHLRQRLNHNSGLFTGKALSGNFVARNENPGTVSISMYYNESAGLLNPVEIVSGDVGVSYSEKRGSVILAASANSQTSATAYVDIYLTFPASSVTRVTSIQVVPTASTSSTDLVPFDEISANRDQSRMGDYFIPALEARPVPSLLTGWDFPLNPAQLGATQTIDGTAAYKWDQTIAVRTTANVAMTRNSVTSGAQFINSGATEGYYILQYLSGAQAKKMIGTSLSVNVNAYKGVAGTSATIRVQLFRAPAATAIPTLPTTIGTIAATGIFTLTAVGWTEIPRSGLPTASADLKTITTNDDINSGVDYSFTGWEVILASEIGDTDKFAIVVTFETPTISTTVVVNSISVTPGDIATRPAPQTPDQVLRECQYYYETTFLPGATVPSAVTGGILSAQIRGSVSNSSISTVVSDTFENQFQIQKISVPTVIFYSGTSTTDNRVQAFGFGTSAVATAEIDISLRWGTPVISVKNYYLQSSSITALLTVTDTSTTVPPAAWIEYHYTADSRLGK